MDEPARKARNASKLGEPNPAFARRIAAAASGCVTGIRWGVPVKLAAGIDAAIARQDRDAPVKVGCDPARVQPEDLTLAEACAGRRLLA